MHTSEVNLACALLQDAFGPYVAQVSRQLLLYRSLTFLELRDLLPLSSSSSSSSSSAGVGALKVQQGAAAKSAAAAAQLQQGRDEEYCRLRNALLVLVQHNLLHCTPLVPLGASGTSGTPAPQGDPAITISSSSSSSSSSTSSNAGAQQQQQPAAAGGSSAAAAAAAVPVQPHGGVRYSLNLHAALALLRFPALAAITEETLGANARLLLLQVLRAGRVCMQDAVALAMADPCESPAAVAVAAAAAAG